MNVIKVLFTKYKGPYFGIKWDFPRWISSVPTERIAENDDYFIPPKRTA